MTMTQRMIRLFLPLLLLVTCQMARAAQLPDFTQIVRDSSPAVVKIIVQQGTSRTARTQELPQEIPEYFRRFFDYPEGSPTPRKRMGMGSGFIISEDGFIVTNNHVVENAEKVLVRLSDRREFEAEVVGTDPRSDLALIRVEATGLPVLTLADGDAVEVGEWVLAIGSPFGLDYSVTAGIVSAKGRSLPTERNENYVPFIQTDVAINPGNSGGPLFNLDGQVVGVNSQIYTRSGGSIGLSFAIPVNVVRNVVTQLQREGRVTRGWLGVTIQDVDRTLAESFGLDRPMGALIAQVAPGGPADKAGLRSGDVIVNFDGEDIMTSGELPHIVGLMAPDSVAKVKIVRDGEDKTIRVKVGGLEADDSLSLSSDAASDGRGGPLGLVVEDVGDEALERYGISGGVAVREVLPGSAAAEGGIRPGDVITLLESTPVKSVSAYNKAVAKLKKGSSVRVRLIRRGTNLFIGLKLPD